MNGSDQPFWTRVDSNKKMVAPTKPQTNPGVCWKWSMAGPVTCASNKNEEPSTCSPTKKPTVAIIETRPCVISASRKRCKSPPLMPLQKPRMSKPSGNGAHAPSKPAAVASLMSAYCLDLSKTPDPDARTVGYNVLLLLCLVPVVEEIKMSLSVKIFSFFLSHTSAENSPPTRHSKEEKREKEREAQYFFSFVFFFFFFFSIVSEDRE